MYRHLEDTTQYFRAISTLRLHCLIVKACLGEGSYHSVLVFSTFVTLASVIFDHPSDASAVRVMRVGFRSGFAGVAEEFDGGEESQCIRVIKCLEISGVRGMREYNLRRCFL